MDPVQQDAVEGKLVIGIDLGTTKSGVSAWREELGRVAMLPDAGGHEVIPSAVAWDEEQKQWLVGHEAKALLTTRPSDVAYSVKRLIGRPFSDPVVRASQSDVTYSVVGGGTTDALEDVLVQFGAGIRGAELLSVPKVSAKVLERLRQTAADSLGLALDDVSYAVITVPAYFNVLQRRATIRAGEEAGLVVVDILNEPTAAALAHGDVVLGPDERTILIYDLGGGTFDVSLLDTKRDRRGSEFFTRVVNGHTRLGGDDIDSALADRLAGEAERMLGRRLRRDAVTRSRMRVAAEQAKIALSTADHARVDLHGLSTLDGDHVDAALVVTREELERCAAGVIGRAREITDRTVREIARLTWEDIDEVILVGGQALMPAVARDVEALTGRPPRVSQRPQTAIALGAGEYGRILSQGRPKFSRNSLTNVIALALGVRLDDGSFRRVVDANSNVPIRGEMRVTTTVDNQTEIEVEVLQGPHDATRADQCVVLGTLQLDVPPAPARALAYIVRFEVAEDGTLNIEVVDPGLRRSQTLVIGETTRVLVLREQREVQGGTPA
jgi:molecular chaperone DnaK